MGGDHKCPVCQATFTRPQHVARHMRSHTGDRPYKCQYCGDQFARSDLLSRHVNKCHANEKPLATIGTRRKGSASASRATTSKQACDQCVQSSLPCDGCNPCSKCVQRKCRCTYVKFHRQTAPVGPGHNNPSASNSSTASASGMVPLPSSSSSRLPPFPHQPEDDFILGPPPSAMSVSGSSGGGLPTMAETLYNSNTFSFPALYPSATSSSATGLDADAYRAQAQAELFGSGRTSLAPLYDPVPRGTSASSSGTAPGSAAGTGASSSWLGWGQQQQSHHQGSHSNDTYHHQSQHQHRINAHNLLPSISGGGPHPSTTGASAMHDKFQPLQEHQQHYMNMPYPVSVPASYLPHAVGSRPSTGNSNSGSVPDAAAMDIGRRGSIDTNVSVDALDPYGGAGSDGSHSVPSSAASSSVHLPLGMIHGFNAGYNLALGVPDRASTASTSTTSSSSSHHHARGDSDSSYAGGPGGTGGGYVAPDERQEFSSAFGLMSLDDPNVLAGLAVDGQPFFSDPNQAHNQQGQEERRGDDQDHQHASKANDNAILGTDMDTPMPIKRSSGLLSGDLYLGGSLKGPGGNTLPTPSREMDAREMREFWKQYMRTPLSGPGDANGNATPSGPVPNANANINKGSQGSTSFRRQRVSSLPSVKTPIIEYDQMYGAHDQYYHHHHHHHHGGHQQQQPGGDAKLGPMSSIRTTLHGNAEDLRSYEAAVLAREAPALMNLQLKRPAKKTGGNGGQSRDNGKSNNPKNVIALDAHPKKEPSSPALSQNQTHSLGTPSTLANALSPSKEEGASPALSSSSTHSHSREPSSAHDESDTELRPSFKRLPSQTLGPVNAKRTFYGFNDEDENRELVGWGSGTSEGPASAPRNRNNAGGSTAGGSIDVSHADRVVASLAERRRRRMSAPGASLNLQSLPSPFPTTAVDRDNKNGEGSYISHVPVAAYARGRPVGK